MSMELVHNRCLFTDKQMIRLQVGGGVGGSVEISVISLPKAPSGVFFKPLTPKPNPPPRAHEFPPVVTLL